MSKKGPVIGGRVISYEPMLPASACAKQGRRLRHEADWAMRDGRREEAQRLYRRAIELLVDAFLIDRAGHRLCFAEAHRVGALVREHFGCPLVSHDEGEHWSVDCGILALHQRLGTSFAAPTRGRCSICGADDLGCLHVPGKTYADQRCVRIIYDVDLREVHLVAIPKDPRCYRTQVLRSREEIETAYGGPLPSVVRAECTHCAECYGTSDGARPEDVDRRLWPDINIGGGE